MKIINNATPGYFSLTRDAQRAALYAFTRRTMRADDTFYSVPKEEIPGGLPDGEVNLFFVENETGGFTAMLGGEY